MEDPWRTKAVWEEHSEEMSPEEVVREAARSCPPKTAEAMVQWACVRESQRLDETKADVYKGPDEQAAWEATREWLRKWKASPERLGAAEPAQQDQRAGGPLEDAGQGWKKRKRKARFDPGPPEEIDRGPAEAPEDAEEVLETKPRAAAAPRQVKKRKEGKGIFPR